MAIMLPLEYQGVKVKALENISKLVVNADNRLNFLERQLIASNDNIKILDENYKSLKLLYKNELTKQIDKVAIVNFVYNLEDYLDFVAENGVGFKIRKDDQQYLLIPLEESPLKEEQRKQ